MTRATVQGYITRAQRALGAGNCEVAQEHLNDAWEALMEYAPSASPTVAKKFKATIASLFTKAGRSCGEDALMGGVVANRGEWLPYVGMALASIGLVIGFGTLYKSWD